MTESLHCLAQARTVHTICKLTCRGVIYRQTSIFPSAFGRLFEVKVVNGIVAVKCYQKGTFAKNQTYLRSFFLFPIHLLPVLSRRISLPPLSLFLFCFFHTHSSTDRFGTYHANRVPSYKPTYRRTTQKPSKLCSICIQLYLPEDPSRTST